MAGLYANSPDQLFYKFKDHLNALLHRTIVQAPLAQVVSPPGIFLGFRQNNRPVCVKVGRRYHLYIGQTLQAVKEGDRYRLRTLAYAYRIAEGPSFDDPPIFRWEYNAREYKPALHPRHHLHLPATITCFGNRILDAEQLHIPSGWVMVEEVIRFLVHELGVKPVSQKWDERLRESEEQFREWTGRSV